MHAANDEERAVGLRTWGPKGQVLNKHAWICIREAPYFHIFQQYKETATGNENFQPEIESNEYSSTRSSPIRWPIDYCSFSYL